MQEDKKVLKQFDADNDGVLNLTERTAAREFLAAERASRPQRGPGGSGPPFGPDGAGAPAGGPGGPDGPRGPGGGPGGGGGGPFGRRNQTPPEPGPKLTPAEVKSYRAMPLYDLQTLRTVFLELETPDWEKELADFKNTDVEVPAKMIVDGKTYNDVGVRFRGASSFMMVSEGRKRSLNLSLDLVRKKQDLGGYRNLNLLNSNGDPTMLRAVLYNQIAREYIPAPKTNFVRVVINSENWGIYVNVQQFDKEFLDEWFGTKKGDRWKAPGRPNGNSGLEYLGEDVAEYKKRFSLKSKENPEAWTALIELCRVLNQTPAEELEKALTPLLDVEGALKFLALENVFINSDGYWTRASDYGLYRDEAGQFHVVPHDTNETFQAAGGPGMRGGGEGKGLELDPLVATNDAKKPLISKLLAVPALRARYLGYVREIAERWLDWKKLGPLAEQYHALIAEDVKLETRLLGSQEGFAKGVGEDIEVEGGRGPRRSLSLKSFVEQRRTFLLSHPEVTAAHASAMKK